MPSTIRQSLRAYHTMKQGMVRSAPGRRVQAVDTAGPNPADPITYSREQIWALAIMLLMHMADMRTVTTLEVESQLGLDHAAAWGLLSGLRSRGWLMPHLAGWQLTATGWLLASAEASDELELTFTAAE